VIHATLFGMDAMDSGLFLSESLPRPVATCLHARGRRLLVSAGLVCLGGLLFLVDVPVARWCRVHRLPGDLGRLIDLSEAFAHSLSVAVILIVTVFLDPALRRAGRLVAARWEIGRMVLATFAGGLTVDVLKLLITRVRPRAVDFAKVTSVLDTFGTAARQVAAGGGDAAIRLGKSADLMSFPSGHAAVAAGLATVLSWKYPHGLPIFAALAAMAATQRVVSSAHYPSDVAFGAACGVALAAVCLGNSKPAMPSASGALPGTMADRAVP
jgi:membrane-associated phospholipid phosphatase